MTIVADSAMLSKANIDSLIENNFKFIVSARIKNLSQKITKEILAEQDYQDAGCLSYKSIILGDDKTLISVFSDDRKRKDEYEREKLLNKLQKLEGKTSRSAISTKLKKPYVKLSNESTIEIDYDQIETSKKLDGYFGFITNTNLKAEEVISQYKGLWQVEQSFRITKHNLKIRPVYHFVYRRIKAHFAICYISFTLLRMLEYMMKQADCYIPLETLHDLLAKIKVVKLKLSKVESCIITDIPSNIQKLFTSLKIKIPTRYRGQSRV